MAAACRVGDTCAGTCNIGAPDCPHTYSGGTCDTGSPSVFINKKAAVRVNDTGATHCPHGGSFKSSAGSATVFINGKAAVRVGDSITCNTCAQGGSHTTGSGSVFIGG